MVRTAEPRVRRGAWGRVRARVEGPRRSGTRARGAGGAATSLARGPRAAAARGAVTDSSR